MDVLCALRRDDWGAGDLVAAVPDRLRSLVCGFRYTLPVQPGASVAAPEPAVLHREICHVLACCLLG